MTFPELKLSPPGQRLKITMSGVAKFVFHNLAILGGTYNEYIRNGF